MVLYQNSAKQSHTPGGGAHWHRSARLCACGDGGCSSRSTLFTPGSSSYRRVILEQREIPPDPRRRSLRQYPRPFAQSHCPKELLAVVGAGEVGVFVLRRKKEPF